MTSNVIETNTDEEEIVNRDLNGDENSNARVVGEGNYGGTETRVGVKNHRIGANKNTESMEAVEEISFDGGDDAEQGRPSEEDLSIEETYALLKKIERRLDVHPSKYSMDTNHVHTRGHNGIQRLRRRFGTTDHRRMNYPEDCYMLIAHNGPKNWRWSAREVKIFMFGSMMFVIQIMFLYFVFCGQVDPVAGYHDNPDAGKGFFATFLPSNVSPIVRAAQVASMLAYALFPESTLYDFAKAIQLWPRSWNDAKYPVWSMGFSCCLRIGQSLFGILVVWILVMTSNTALEIVLNFTAMNFISELDELAFSLAKDGVFGAVLRDETTQRFPNLELPSQYYRKPKYFWIAMIFALVTLIGGVIAISVVQDNDQFWTTQIMRIQFRDEGFEGYSGCYAISDKTFHQRYVYDGYGQAIGKNASLGYCINESEWILYEQNDSLNPCDGVKLAKSPKTDTYDVSSSFDGSWVSSSNKPIDFFFFKSGWDEIQLHCDISMDDGVCDPAFNMLDFDYDGGDCCASTCYQSNCGRGGENRRTVFGNSVYAEIDFPHCINPDMVSIAIDLNNIKSSREAEFINSESPWLDVEMTEVEWRTETPVDTYLALNCDSKNILSFHVYESMMNESETVMVNDGANCLVEVRNTTHGIDSARDGPIWIVDYTIWLKDGKEQIQILNQTSNISKEFQMRISENSKNTST